MGKIIWGISNVFRNTLGQNEIFLHFYMGEMLTFLWGILNNFWYILLDIFLRFQKEIFLHFMGKTLTFHGEMF